MKFMLKEGSVRLSESGKGSVVSTWGAYESESRGESNVWALTGQFQRPSAFSGATRRFSRRVICGGCKGV
jgi:hypothetical protein